MATRRVIGRLIPSRTVDLPSTFERFIINKQGFDERLGLIPASISPAQMNAIREGAARGELGPLYELYLKMEATDSRYGGLVSSLKSAISGMPLKVIEAEGLTAAEKELAADYAALVNEQLALLDNHNLMKAFAEPYIVGAKAYELRYSFYEFGGKRLPLIDEVRPIPGSVLKMDMRLDSPTRGELMIRTRDFTSGKPLSSFHRNKVFVLEDGIGRGFYDTMGAARKCLAWWLTKIYAQLWWSEFVEVYGQPLRIAKYPEGAGSKAKATMERFLQTLGKSAYGLFPQGMELQLIEANKSGTVTTYQDLIKFANDEMAIALMGQVDTMGGRREGSYAKTKVLDGIRYEILENVAAIVAKGYQKIVRALIEVNYGSDYNRRLLPRVHAVLVSPEDGRTKAETYEILSRTGVPLSMDHIFEQMGIPKPKVGEKVNIGGRIVTYEEGIEEKLHAEKQQAAQTQPQPNADDGE